MPKVLLLICFLLSSASAMQIDFKELAKELMEEVFDDKLKTDKHVISLDAIDKGKTNLEDEKYVENDGNACSGDTCPRSSILHIGQCLHSRNRNYQLCMQADGNLVIYCHATGSARATWATGTDGKAVRQGLYFQSDGNLVLYNYANRPLWASGTHHTEADRLVMQDDGNLVVYGRHNGVFWASGTNNRC